MKPFFQFHLISYLTYPSTKAKKKALKAFLKALEIPYTKEKTDETAYLLSTKANRKRLLKSIRETKEGKVVTVTLDEIWRQ